jgi:hypothetical protein
MRGPFRSVTRSWLRMLVGAALAVLAVGAAVHVGHHLLEPGCESETAGGLHPCTACASLHAAAIVVHDDVALPPLPHASDLCAECPATASVPDYARAGHPRAPPKA